MKAFKKYGGLLLMASTLSLLMGCDPESIDNGQQTPPQSVPPQYSFTIGTQVHCGQNPSPAGGTLYLVEQTSGPAKVVNQSQVFAVGSVDVALKDGSGETLPIYLDTFANRVGDFSFTYVTPRLSSPIESILGLKLKIQVTSLGKKYTKNIDYSGTTLWGRLGGFKEAVLDYGLSEDFRGVSGGLRKVCVDIANDIFLRHDTSTNKIGEKPSKKEGSHVSNTSRSTIKEVQSSSSKAPSKGNKVKQQ